MMDDITKQVQRRIEQEKSDDEYARGFDDAFIQECLFANSAGDGMLFASLFREKFVFVQNNRRMV